jgi:hypothetical protein
VAIFTLTDQEEHQCYERDTAEPQQKDPDHRWDDAVSQRQDEDACHQCGASDANGRPVGRGEAPGLDGGEVLGVGVGNATISLSVAAGPLHIASPLPCAGPYSLRSTLSCATRRPVRRAIVAMSSREVASMTNTSSRPASLLDFYRS